MRHGSLSHTWKPVTIEEMKGFIGTILNMWIVKLSNLKDYWAKNDITNLPFFTPFSPTTDFFKSLGLYMQAISSAL